MNSAQQIPHSSTRFYTLLWLALIVLTVVTYLIGEEGFSGTIAMCVVLGIAIVKGQIVASHFMGLRHTRFMWRAIMFTWLTLVGSMIAFAYLLGTR